MAQSSQSDKSSAQYADQLYQIACDHYKNKDFDEAEKHFNQLLKIQETHPQANYSLGLLALQKKQPAASLRFFEAALDSNPTYGSCWLAYIDALDQSGQADMARNMLEIAQMAGLDGEAFDSLANRLRITPKDRDEQNNPFSSITGQPESKQKKVASPAQDAIDHIITLYQQGRFEECEKKILLTLADFPDHGFSWKVLGAIFKQQGHLEKAIDAMKMAARLLQEDPEVLNNLGITYKEQGKLNDSAAALLQALGINNDFAEAHNSLGVTLMAQGNLKESEECFHKAIHLQPEYVEAFCNLGTNLKNQGLYLEAEKYFRHALTLNPLYAECLNNLGNLLQGTSRLSEAETVLCKAIELKPDFAIAYNTLGNVLQGQGHLEESERYYCKALEIKPDYSEAFDGLLFVSNYHADKSASEIFKLYEEYNRRFGLPLQKQWKQHKNDKNSDRRLKIAYVSPAFHSHPIFNHLEPLLANHDKTRFEIYAYAELTREDRITLRCKKYFDHWLPTTGLSDNELAERIYNDGIDILVDLAGHTTQNRLGVFARKPAPVSLHWLDFGYTTGLTAIDYYLTDFSTGPIGSEDLFSEQLWRLPVPPFTYRPSPDMGEVSALPAKQKGHITFGTLTRSIRLNRHTIRVWSDILKQVKGSRLIINSNNYKDPAIQNSLKEKFSANGVNDTQLDIGYDSPPWDILRDIDICLDCFPHNSGTTLFESLYMGIPFITLAGKPGVGRLGSSILEGISHSEWIAGSEEEYIQKTITLAADIQQLASVRNNLRQELMNSALMDEAGFARAVEDAYRAMFKKWSEDTSRPCNQDNTSLQPKDGDTPAITSQAADFYNRGIELQQKNHLDEAQSAYIQSINLQNDFVNGYNNLGVVFQQKGQLEEAVQCFMAALKHTPDSFDVCFNLANTYKLQNELFKAEATYRKVLQIVPDHADAHYYLGNILQAQGCPKEGEEHLKKALEINPDHIKAFSTLLFTLNYHPDKKPEEIFQAYVEFNKKFCEPLHAAWLPHTNDRNSERRLKIGYVAPGYRKHPARFFVEPLLANHNKHVVETFAYIELQQKDSSADLFHTYVDHWTPVAGMTDSALYETIRTDEIDILVDLSGHTSGNRLKVFAMRPAPVSLHWLDFGYTTGLSAIDYYLTDQTSVPKGSEQFFSETPWYLNTPALAYRPPAEVGDISPLPARHNNDITFGTLTRAVRINDKTIQIWSQILKQCENSRLIIDSSSFKEPAMQDALADKFKKYGINRERLEIGFHSPPWDVLRNMDIMFDCFPHNSGTTLIESLYMGVPYVTLADRPSVGRLGSSILKGVGHPEWIAETEDEYIETALLLASDLNNLAAIRSNLRTEMTDSPLMDEQNFTAEVEDAYRKMFINWCKIPQSSDKQHFTRKNKPIKKKTKKTRKTVSTKPPGSEIKKLARLYDTGKNNNAIKLAQSLTSRYPHHGFAWKVLGPLLFQQGQREKAILAMTQATHYLPEDSDTHYNLGIALQQSNLLDDAVSCYKKAIEINSHHIDAHYNLANILKDQGSLTEAEKYYSHILRLKPQHFEALCNLGNVLRKQRRFGEAIDCYQAALDLKPNSAALYNNISLILKEQGLLDQAESVCCKAIELLPKMPEAHNNLGRIYQEQGRLAEAESSYRKALEYKENYSMAYCNLGLTLQKQGRLTEAEHIYRQALASDVSNSKLLQNLGLIQIRKGQLSEAEENLREAIKLKPDDIEIYSNLLFLLNNHPDKSAEEIFAEYEKVNVRFFSQLQTERTPSISNNDLNRKLKVGYVSFNFRKHSTRHFLEPLLAHHDKEKVEIFLYTDLVSGDEVTERYKSYADHWVQTTGSTDSELAQRIQNDGIDILIDLAGHTEKNRLGVFARRPAPVSLHWLDFGYTTGLTAIDYYLTDTVSVPPESKGLFSETPWCMEPPCVVYRPAENMGVVNTLPALERGYVCFGTFTRTLRINYKTIRVWAEILKRVENSHLVIDSSDFKDSRMQEEMINNFTALGISRERLEIGFHSPPWDLFRRIDIGLDCFPHNSGTTLIETLYMGSPFITLADRPSVGRLGSSILEGVGHPEWIAQTEDEYVQIVVALASDLPKLNSLRENLRHEMENSALMAEKAFTLKVETAYREMFKQWVAQNDKETDKSHAKLITDGLQQAMICQQSGLLTEAAELYQSIIEIAPETHEAQFNLGSLLKQEDPSSALPFFEAAVNACPEHGPYWLAYIKALSDNEQIETAWQLLEKAIQAGLEGKETDKLRTSLKKKLSGSAINENDNILQNSESKPDPGQDVTGELITLFEQNKFNQCETLARLHLQKFQNNGFILKALGLSLKMQNKSAEAVSILQNALKISPDDREISHNLGDIFHADKQFITARDYYLLSLTQNPHIAETHFALANTLIELDDVENAEKHYITALELKHDFAEARFNLGHLYQRQNRLTESQHQYQKAIEFKAGFFKAYSNLGIILQLQGNLKEAESCYKNALQINPDFTDSHINLGACLKDQGRYREAEKSYRAALKTHPGYALCHSNLGSVLKEQGKIDEAEEQLRYALKLSPDSREIHSNLLFLLNYHPDKNGEEIFTEYQRFNSRFGVPHHREWQPHTNSPQYQRRLKIGYVSPQFKLHSIRHFFEPLLAHHDKNKVEIFAYAEMTNEDSVSERYRSYVDHWITTVGMSDAALASKIRKDKIDILIDLAGHTAHNRLGMFALKPAPVSMHWLDFGYTTGLSAIDYYLTDHATAPEGSEKLFSETPWRLKTPSIVYRPAEGMGDVSPLPADQRGYITFGMLTRAVRINHRTISVWSEILKQVKGSRLVIDSNNFRDATMHEEMAAMFLTHGIGPERLQIGFHTPPWDILRGFDISLDCFPHNSGTTLLEILYMGIPFITLADRPSVGRLGCSILEGVGHPEWIAGTEEEYIETAVTLATDLDKLGRLRSGLRQEMESSPLMDEPAYAEKVEKAYKKMFQKWCEEQQ